MWRFLFVLISFFSNVAYANDLPFDIHTPYVGGEVVRGGGDGYYYNDPYSAHVGKSQYCVDFNSANNSGFDVVATADGTVLATGPSSVYESVFDHDVVIEHKSGYRSLYMHLRSNSVTVGQKVHAGEVIGVEGAEGTQHSHLHFCIYDSSGESVKLSPMDGVHMEDDPESLQYGQQVGYVVTSRNSRPPLNNRTAESALAQRESSRLSDINPFSGHGVAVTVEDKLGQRNGDFRMWFDHGVEYSDSGIPNNAYVQHYAGGEKEGAIIVHPDTHLPVHIYGNAWTVWSGGDTSEFSVVDNCGVAWFSTGYGPESQFGLPITSVYYVDDSDRWRQDFQAGYTSWNPDTQTMYLNCYDYSTPGWSELFGWDKWYAPGVTLAYERNGGKEIVGYAADDSGGYLLHPWNYVYIQNFTGGAFGSDVAIIANTSGTGPQISTEAAVVRDGFWQYYVQHNGSVEFGSPLGDEMDTNTLQGKLFGYDPFCDKDTNGSVSESERWNCINDFCGSGYSSMQRFANVTLCYNGSADQVSCDPGGDNCHCPGTGSCSEASGGGGSDPEWNHDTPSPKVHRRYKPFTGDFNGDGYTDVGVYEPAYGYWYIALSTGTAFAPSGANNGRWLSGWGTERRSAWQYEPIVGDFNGDGIDDVGLHEKYYGYWYIALSTGSAFVPTGPNNGRWLEGFGAETDYENRLWRYQAIVGDFNGDGMDDVGVYEAKYGYWYAAMSRGSYFDRVGAYSNQRWLENWAVGNESDELWRYRPIVGDFNGDGMDDVIAYEPEYGYWYVAVSELGAYFRPTEGHSSRWLENWAIAVKQFQYHPIVGDFNGDNVQDIGVYEEQYGFWYAAMNRDTYFEPVGAYANKRWLEEWGTARREQYQYVPLTGDFNGDGQDDIIAYEPDYGYWYVAVSEDGGWFRPAGANNGRWLYNWATNDE